MNSIWTFFLLALVAGFTLPTQAGINVQLNQWSQSAILAATISFAVGTIGLFVYALCLRIPWPAVDTMFSHPWWIWTGGLLGAFFCGVHHCACTKAGGRIHDCNDYCRSNDDFSGVRSFWLAGISNASHQRSANIGCSLTVRGCTISQVILIVNNA
jgi:hypothetical protein